MNFSKWVFKGYTSKEEINILVENARKAVDLALVYRTNTADN